MNTITLRLTPLSDATVRLIRDELKSVMDEWRKDEELAADVALWDEAIAGLDREVAYRG